MFTGPYDHLGTFKREAADAWEIQILPQAADPVEVVDAKTRLPLERFSDDAKRWERVISALVAELLSAQAAKRACQNPLTVAATEFGWRYRPEEMRQMWVDMGLEEPE
jgi:hypothetical protein